MLYIASAKGNTAGEAAVRARGASRNTRETDGEGKNTNRLKNTKQACTGIAQLRAVAGITKNIPGQTLRLLSQAGVQSHVYQARTITTTRSTSYGAPAAAPPCCSRLRRLPRFTSRCASEDDCTISTPVSDHLKLDTLSFSWMPLVPLSPPQTQPCQAFRVRQSSTLLQPSVRAHADRLQLLSTSTSAYHGSLRRSCWPNP
jgi:hypothetical protein